jgi:hypothetical protein
MKKNTKKKLVKDLNKKDYGIVKDMVNASEEVLKDFGHLTDGTRQEIEVVKGPESVSITIISRGI